ncbi:MAG: Nitrogen permease regulator 3 [Chrysothrix sp. TS-e1954]|nr:MAG: Nitrogen permease regulator 3 [Chrysothrix sp. TS-e1954]
MNQPLPPKPCLLAVLLVARTGAGPKVVLHYPPNPSVASLNPSRAQNEESDDSDSDDDDDESLDGSWLNASRRRGSAGTADGTIDHDVLAQGLDDREDEHLDGFETAHPSRHRTSEKSSGWKTLFGFSRDGIAKMMAPNTRTWHKRKLEIGLDDLAFVGCPIYCRKEGGWDKKRNPESRSGKLGVLYESQNIDDEPRQEVDPRLESSASNAQHLRSDDGASEHHSSSTGSQPVTSPIAVKSKPTSPPPSRNGIGTVSQSLDSQFSNESGGSQTSGSLSMFNIVFIMCPPYSEHQYRIHQMYEHVISRLGSGLAKAQRKQNFVEKEVKRIDKKMTEAKDSLTYASAWAHLPRISPLARALQQVYTAISSSQIAYITLGNTVHSADDSHPSKPFSSLNLLSLSLQLPQPLSTQHAPTPHFPSLNLGVPLLSTPYTSTTLPYDSTLPSTVSKHAALILTHPSPTHLSNLLTTPPLSQTSTVADLIPVLHFFIHHVASRKTLLQLTLTPAFRAAGLSDLADVEFIAMTLISLRFARAIPPLNPSNTYVINPNANFHLLSTASAEYNKRFGSLAPALEVILGKLGKVKAEGKAGATMGARPWAALIPSKDHKSIYMEILAWLVRGSWVVRLATMAWVRVPNSVVKAVERQRAAQSEASAAEDDQLGDGMGDDSLNTPRRGSRRSSAAPSSGSSGAETAVLTTSAPAAQPPSSSSPPIRSPPFPVPDTTSSEGVPYLHTLIPHPASPTPVQRSQLDYIQDHLLDDECKEWFPKLLKYFDGRTPLEDIGVRREGWGRKRVSGVLRKLAELQVAERGHDGETVAKGSAYDDDDDDEGEGKGEEGRGQGIFWIIRGW